MQLLLYSLLTGPAAKKIWSSQTVVGTPQLAVATLQLALGLPPSRLRLFTASLAPFGGKWQAHIGCLPFPLLPCSLLTGPAAKTGAVRLQLLPCSLLSRSAAKKSRVVRLQLLPRSLLTGPAAKKLEGVRLASIFEIRLIIFVFGDFCVFKDIFCRNASHPVVAFVSVVPFCGLFWSFVTSRCFCMMVCGAKCHFYGHCRILWYL